MANKTRTLEIPEDMVRLVRGGLRSIGSTAYTNSRDTSLSEQQREHEKRVHDEMAALLRQLREQD